MISINKPDVSIIDISMPGLDGIKVATKIKDLNLNTKVIILTMHKMKQFLIWQWIAVLLAM